MTGFNMGGWSRISGGGLRGLNGFMAILCGLGSVLVGLKLAAYIVIFLLSVYSEFNSHPSPSPVFTAEIKCAMAHGLDACKKPTGMMKPGAAYPDAAGVILDWVGFALNVVPLMAVTYGLVRASACFVNLSKKRYFDRRTISQFRDFALCGLIFLLIFPNANTIGVKIANIVDNVLNSFRPKGHFVLHIAPKANMALDGLYNFLPVVYALLLTVIAGVMTRAASIVEDHAQIV